MLLPGTKFRVAIVWFLIGEIVGIILAALTIAVLVKSIINQ